MKGAANAGRPRSRAGHGSADLDMQEIPPRHLAAYVRQVFHAADEAGVSCDLPVTRVLAVIFSTLDRACEQRNGSQDASNLDIAFQSTDSRGSPLLHVLLACDSRLCCAVLERYGAQLSARALWAWDCQGRTALAVAQLMGVHGRDVASRLVHLCQLPRSCVYPVLPASASSHESTGTLSTCSRGSVGDSVPYPPQGAPMRRPVVPCPDADREPPATAKTAPTGAEARSEPGCAPHPLRGHSRFLAATALACAAAGLHKFSVATSR